MSKTASTGRPGKAPDKVRYRAPALEKGLEILEFLASQTEPMTLSNISQELNRSRSEIFRMVQELEICGYIQHSLRGDGYEITNKLFLLGLEQPRTHTLLEVALPVMRDFSAATRQSCHIAVQADDLMVVIARMEAPTPVGLSVRVGHRMSLVRSTSGPTIFAHQPADVQEAFLARWTASAKDFDAGEFRKLAAGIRKRGYFQRDSSYVKGVKDLAAPIMRQGSAIAAFTAPCLERLQADGQGQLPVTEVCAAAEQISQTMSPR